MNGTEKTLPLLESEYMACQEALHRQDGLISAIQAKIYKIADVTQPVPGTDGSPAPQPTGFLESYRESNQFLYRNTERLQSLLNQLDVLV